MMLADSQPSFDELKAKVDAEAKARAAENQKQWWITMGVFAGIWFLTGGRSIFNLGRRSRRRRRR